MSFLSQQVLPGLLSVSPSAYTLLLHAVSFWSFMGYSPSLGSEVLMLPTIAASRQDSESVESKGRSQAPKHLLGLGLAL